MVVNSCRLIVIVTELNCSLIAEMTGCCAFGCTNRSEKGFSMFRFPSNPERRKIWESKVCRSGWKPTSSSFLCQEHFDETQFENGRVDGKKKLRCSAVPTIFSHRQPPKTRKSAHVKRQSAASERTVLADHAYSIEPLTREPAASSSAESGVTEENDDIVTDGLQLAPTDKVIYIKMQGQINKLKAELRKTRKKCEAIQKAKLKQEARIGQIFAKDQLESTSRRRMNGVLWTSATVKKALQLRFACGSSGYKFLLREKYPLPSERTLQRRRRVQADDR